MSKKTSLQPEICGILNINKPPEVTSHKVVSRVRKLLDTRRVGHAGTLDPMATGVLVVCVGRATRLSEYLVGSDKEYLAEATFGLTTDTQDITGQVISQTECSFLDETQLRAAMAGFAGDILQIPPMVSAIQVGGERLYMKALRGEEIEREARQIRIAEFELLSFEPGLHPKAKLRIVCSKGTYIRTLCHDLGSVLGCGATLSSLVRSRIGTYRLEDAITLEELEQHGVSALQPMVSGVLNLSEFRATEQEAHIMINGGWVRPEETQLLPDQIVRIMGSETELIGIGSTSMTEKGLIVQPDKIVVPRNT